jgi:hypothetical protein
MIRRTFGIDAALGHASIVRDADREKRLASLL